jgi:hypothetical protein
MLALRDAAVEFVGRLKQKGLPAEWVIVALRTPLCGHGPAGWLPSLDAESGTPRAAGESTVYANLFRWCVEAYYCGVPHGLPCCSGAIPPAAAARGRPSPASALGANSR